MDVRLAVLADAANVSAEGKLNIFGIFNLIGARNFPAVHPQMQLVLALEADTAEQGQTKTIEVQLSGPDGQRIFALGGKLEIPLGEPGYPLGMNHILTMNGLKFERPGDHVFTILINDDPKERVPLMVRQPPSKGSAS